MGACTGGVPRACADANGCTVDDCDEAGDGCVNDAGPLEATDCDDGDRCTANDVCLQGVCRGGPLDCGDGQVCTLDRCEPGLGCVHEPVNEGMSCFDGDDCTEPDTCQAGTCAGPRLCAVIIEHPEGVLEAKPTVGVLCAGQPYARCAMQVVAAVGATPAAGLPRDGLMMLDSDGDVLADLPDGVKRKGGRRIKRKSVVKLELKLTEAGDRLLDEQGEVQAVLLTTVTEFDGTSRSSRRQTVLRRLPGRHE